MTDTEYPSGMQIMNSGNDTLVGKVFIDGAADIKIPFYKDMSFTGSEEKSYKMDTSNFMMETYSTGDRLNLGQIFLNLPSPMEVLQDLEDLIPKMLKE